MNDLYLRTESIKPDDIRRFSVINAQDKSIISALCASEPCLLEGSRGTGKSFLMRVAEQELESRVGKDRVLPVFVSFNISSLIETDDQLQFYHWMLAKTLKALMNKLRKGGFVISSESASLLSNDEFNSASDVESDLKKIVKDFENSYKGKSIVTIDNLPDIEDVKEAIENICVVNKIERVFFFFDEAAHVFRPEQQRQFFSLFKDLRSPYITCNAAIYPGVTYFGDSFEPTHDCLYKKIERDIKDSGYVEYFKEIVSKQAQQELIAAIEKGGELFSTLAFAGGGNPRMVLRTIQDLQKFNSSSVDQVVKDFYRTKIWTEHTELGEKYRGHKPLIDWGRDFLESNVIPAIEKYNQSRKERGASDSTIYFWVHKDAPETVKESLRLLTYTSVIRRTDSSIRATRSELGARYEVKYGCVISLFSNPHSESKAFYGGVSKGLYPEFGKSHSSYHGIANLSGAIEDDASFRNSVKAMLKKPVSVLQLLTRWQIQQLQNAGINTIEDLYDKSEDDLISTIYNVGPARARLMKNAATAELLEYLSG